MEAPLDFVAVDVAGTQDGTRKVVVVDGVRGLLHFNGNTQVVLCGNTAEIVALAEKIPGVEDETRKVGMNGDGAAGFIVREGHGVLPIRFEPERMVVSISHQYILRVGGGYSAAEHSAAGEVKRGALHGDSLAGGQALIVHLEEITDICFHAVIQYVMLEVSTQVEVGMIRQGHYGVLVGRRLETDLDGVIVAEGVVDLGEDGAGETVAAAGAFIRKDDGGGVTGQNVLRVPDCGAELKTAVQVVFATVLGQLVDLVVQCELSAGNAPCRSSDGGTEAEILVDSIVMGVVKAQHHIFQRAIPVRDQHFCDRCAELGERDLHAVVVLQRVQKDGTLPGKRGALRVLHGLFDDVHILPQKRGPTV